MARSDTGRARETLRFRIVPVGPRGQLIGCESPGQGRAAFHEFNLTAKRIEVGKVPCAQVVQDSNFVVTPNERLGDVRPDESCPPGYQKRPRHLLLHIIRRSSLPQFAYRPMKQL